MSGPTTFSYAQAAKGAPPAKDLAKDRPTAAQPDSHAKDDASSVTTGPDGAANTFSTTSEVSESAKSSQFDVDVSGLRKSSDTVGTPAAAPASSKDDSSNTARDETAKTNAQFAAEKSTRHSNRSGEATDSKKGRKGKKARSSEKESESEQAPAEPEKEVEPVRLQEAPQPVVNIWAQRAAAAKARQPSVVASPITSTDPSTKTAVDVPAKTASNTEAQTPAERGTAKPTDTRQPIDQSARRNPRGNRASDKSEQPQSVPSSAAEDASMWPTPETAAAEDGKRRTSEPDQPSKEKMEDGTKSIRQKRDWKKVEITPTVVFETPLPPPRTMNKARGGGQAGRSSASRGHTSSVSISSEKGQGAVADGTTIKDGAEPRGRAREDAAPRTNSVPSDKTKRFSVDQQNQRKQSVPSVNRGSDLASKSESFKASKAESIQFTPSRGEGPEGSRKEGGVPNHKDSKPRRGAHGNSNGRGGHNQQTFLSNGHGGSRSSTYSPPNFTPGFSSNQYGGGGRGGRGRPVSLSNGFKGPSSTPKMHQHPQSASSDFGQYPAFGQAPYPPQLDPANYFQVIHQTLKKQMEYYFSEDNLVKDGYLRAHMDAQGFVPLDVVAGFRRVTTIAGNQPRDFLRQACADSQEIDFVLGDGHKELVRVRDNWRKWVPETAKDGRSPGPTSFEYRSWHSMHLNPYQHQQPLQPPMPYPSYNPISPPAFGQPPFPAEMYPSYTNGPRFPSAVNGAQANGYGAADNSPLNATVPEFSPVHTGSNGLHSAFSSMNWMDQAMQAAQTLTDEQVAGLCMVVQGQTAKESSKVPNGTSNESEDTTAVKTNGVHTSSDSLNTYVFRHQPCYCPTNLSLNLGLKWDLLMRKLHLRHTGDWMALWLRSPILTTGRHMWMCMIEPLSSAD